LVHVVVTGHDEAGRSVFVQDEQLTGVFFPGLARIFRVWSADGPMVYPDDGTDPGGVDFFPPVGGFRCTVVDLAPEGAVPPGDPPSDIDEAFPGLLDVMEPDEPGMHRTDTTDFGVVMSGTVVLELDDHAEATLSAGDVVVQNGTRHRWRNPGNAPARLVFVSIGANRRPSSSGSDRYRGHRIVRARGRRDVSDRSE
jgi:mannose-6-phosphate isomerase-like protein (cupin superfamily)